MNPEYALFRTKLLNTAQVNISGFCAWRIAFEGVLKRQFLSSGRMDPQAWHQAAYERDVGLLLPNGQHTRTGAEEPS